MKLLNIDDLKEELLAWATVINKPQYLSREDALYIINSLPTIEIIEPERGKWTIVRYGASVSFYARCLCGFEYCASIFNPKNGKEELGPLYNYCPNCGIEMDGEDDY